MRQIPLTRGHVALVDDEDYERLAAHKWHAVPHHTGRWYAKRSVYKRGEKLRTVWMHRDIIGAPDHLLVDHRNRDSLDNRRANLRLATPRQNSANCKHKNPFRGVRLQGKRWMARVWRDGKYALVASTATAEEAARAYDAAASALPQSRAPL